MGSCLSLKKEVIVNQLEIDIQKARDMIEDDEYTPSISYEYSYEEEEDYLDKIDTGIVEDDELINIEYWDAVRIWREHLNHIQ